MRIGDRIIGDGNPPFVIAEAGLNHNGSLERALRMVRIARDAGCDAVKFQTFKAAGVCDAEQMYSYLSQGAMVTERRIEIFKRCELPEAAWPVIKAECDSLGIVFMSTPQNPSDLDILLRVGVPAIKIGSDDLTNEEMLRYCSRDDVGLPIILSTGMSTGDEIIQALNITGWSNVAVLACTSQYPTPPAECNVRRVETLRSVLGVPSGLSDHSQGNTAAVMAVALGASIIEFHFTEDPLLPGPDHSWAKSIFQIVMYVKAIREAYEALGGGQLVLSETERANKARYQRAAPRDHDAVRAN